MHHEVLAADSSSSCGSTPMSADHCRDHSLLDAKDACPGTKQRYPPLQMQGGLRGGVRYWRKREGEGEGTCLRLLLSAGLLSRGSGRGGGLLARLGGWSPRLCPRQSLLPLPFLGLHPSAHRRSARCISAGRTRPDPRSAVPHCNDCRNSATDGPPPASRG